MKKSIIAGLILASLFILTTFILTFVPNAGAQSVTVKWKHFNYVNKVEANPYGGDKNHLVGIFTRRGLNVYENGEVSLASSWGTFDYQITKGEGTGEAYSLYAFEDGSTIMTKYTMKAILSLKDSKGPRKNNFTFLTAPTCSSNRVKSCGELAQVVPCLGQIFFRPCRSSSEPSEL